MIDHNGVLLKTGDADKAEAKVLSGVFDSRARWLLGYDSGRTGKSFAVQMLVRGYFLSWAGSDLSGD